MLIGRTDAEAETPILWLTDANNGLTGKDFDSGKDWRQEKGTTEDEMAGWHQRLYVHEFEQVPGVGDGQGSLACCSPWGRKEPDMTERLHWTEWSSEMSWGDGVEHLCGCVKAVSHTGESQPVRVHFGRVPALWRGSPAWGWGVAEGANKSASTLLKEGQMH